MFYSVKKKKPHLIDYIVSQDFIPELVDKKLLHVVLFFSLLFWKKNKASMDHVIEIKF